MSLVRYPLDLTGQNPSNLVVDDVTHVPINGGRVVSPAYSPFYVDSLVIRDENGKQLIKNVDWEPALHFVQAMQSSGQEVAAVIEFYDKNYFGDITIERCQVLGGSAGTDEATVYTLIRGVDVNQSPTLYWDDFLPYYNTEVPIETPNPSEDIGYTIRLINRIRDTITLNSSKAVTYTSNEIAAAIALAQTRLINIQQRVDAHLTDNSGDAHPRMTAPKAYVTSEALASMTTQMLAVFERTGGSVLDTDTVGGYSLSELKQLAYVNLSPADFTHGVVPTDVLVGSPVADGYLSSAGEVVVYATGDPIYFDNIDRQWPDERILEDHDGMPVGTIVGFVPVVDGYLDGYHRYKKQGAGHLWEAL